MPRYPNISGTPDRVDSEGNRLCRNCDNLVAKGRQHYCSEKCMDEFFRNNTWHYVRMDVLKRDRYRCSSCNQRFRKKELDVDHIIPVKMGGSLFNKSNLRTLCRKCHKRKNRQDIAALERLKNPKN